MSDTSDFFARIPKIGDSEEKETEEEEVELKPRVNNEPTAEDQLAKERLSGDDCLDLDKEFGGGTHRRWTVLGNLDL